MPDAFAYTERCPLLFLGDKTQLVLLTPGSQRDVHFLLTHDSGPKVTGKWTPYDVPSFSADLLPVEVFNRNASGKDGGGG